MVRNSISRMKTDQSELDDAAEAQKNSPASGLIGATGSVLHNPVLHSQFELSARTSTRRRKWEFAHGIPVSLDKAGKGFQSSHAIRAR